MLNKIKKSFIIGLMLCQFNVYADDQDNNKELAAKEAYEFGKISIQSKDWRDAIESFQQAANNKRLKEASMYWEAYSHYKIRQKAQAKRLLEKLISSYPDSQWVDDAKVLLYENGDGGESVTYQDALDEELKLFTLQQIMFNNPEKALPKVYKMLEESDSERTKMNAIQLLGLSDHEAVVDYLFRFIESETNEGLQHQAIQMLSLRSGAASRNKLAKLYEKSSSKDIKGAIIQSFIHHDDSTQLLKLMKQEKDEDLSLYMIQMLGIKGESAALKDMYKASRGDQKRAILEALALSGEAGYLYEVIDHETNQEVRNQAIHSLIMVDDEGMGDYLVQLYQKAKDSSEKDIISNVFIATDVDPDLIVGLIKSETSKERKHSLLNALMAMDAVSQVRDLYALETDSDTKQAIIHQLGAMDAVDVLMELYRKDPSIANDEAFFHAFGMTSEALDEDFLIERFNAGNANVKAAVLQALMMQDNVKVMIKLLKSETDHEVKKQIIQTIAITDSDALLDAIED
ncbi:HEAT repeat domain-containing protein [Marinicella litoralis]|uniref:Tetratricopeptide repeat protein n=1 Tax=Marinicella litoralis TaxID=644220 RepID=A0A4R6XZ97_9GAMM|nr:HEAT repeat domain-containing protein [Marinicella litoralis]TDR23870.1 tetratricopeptide repeat protein [Marinicella litoralis]